MLDILEHTLRMLRPFSSHIKHVQSCPTFASLISSLPLLNSRMKSTSIPCAVTLTGHHGHPPRPRTACSAACPPWNNLQVRAEGVCVQEHRALTMFTYHSHKEEHNLVQHIYMYKPGATRHTVSTWRWWRQLLQAATQLVYLYLDTQVPRCSPE